MSTSGIVEAQTHLWYGVILLPSFVIYMIAMVGETNRAPFDLPEAEGELVGGFHTEYSSIKFAFFFLAEYINMVTVSMLATTLFLGGWRAPWPLSIWYGANQGYWPVLWFIAKVLLFIFFFIWLRGTLPRLRYDQFMKFGWKVLIPVALVWIIAVGTIRTISLEGTIDRDVADRGRRGGAGRVPRARVRRRVRVGVGRAAGAGRVRRLRRRVSGASDARTDRWHEYPWGEHQWLASRTSSGTRSRASG